MRRDYGCCQGCKTLVGGLLTTYIDKAESGTDISMDALLYTKLIKQTAKVRRLRIVWFFWMTLSYYGVLVPFTAELAFIPMIGGLLLKLESQTGTMALYAAVVTTINFALIASFIWLRYKPYISLVLWILIATLTTVMFKFGESLPTEYAKYKLGYF